MSNDVVTASELTKQYSATDRPAIDEMTFEISRAETVGLLGPNGAGKTTLIKLICGVSLPTKGSIRVFGADPVRDPLAAKNSIAAMHQHAPFDMMLPAIDNLKIAAKFRGLRWRSVRAWAEETASFLDLDGVLGRLCFQMSGGQRQRLQLVRALLTIPKLLMLDEPSAGLDVAGRHKVEQLVSWLRDQHGVTVVWTTHHIEELERNCQRVMVINQGQLLRLAKPRELVEEFGTAHLLVKVDDESAGKAVVSWAEKLGLTGEASNSEVRIHGGNPRELLSELSRHCLDAGVAVSGVSIASDSLEQVFLRMTEKSNA